MKAKHHVKLTASERKEVQRIAGSEKTTKTMRKRCHVLLMADEHAGNIPTQEEISVRCGVSDVTVYIVIREFYMQGLAYYLRKRIHEKAPYPPIVTGEKEARIVALACGTAPEGRTHWTLRLLREKVIELGIMNAVSYETIRTT